jgi:hypothetical protein
LAIDLLYGDDTTRLRLEAGDDATAACAHHATQREAFLATRQQFLHIGYAT